MVSKKKPLKNKLHLYLLVFILLIGFFFRFYHYFDRVGLSADSNRDAFVAIEGAKTFQLPLIGPFTSIAPVVTGPWYWYQIIFSRIFLPVAYSPWLYLGFLSLLLIVVVYRIGILLESKTFALILALIVAFSPDQISTAYQLNNPVVVGFFATFMFCLFLEIIIKKRSSSWGYLFGIIAGMTFTVHYQTFPLLPLVFLLLVFKRPKTFFKTIIGFMITLTPLLFFELNNHWYNTRNIIDYLCFGQYRIWVSNRWLTFITDFWPKFWVFVVGGKPYLGIFLMIASSIILIEKFIKDKQKRKLLFCIGITFFIGVVFVRYYRGEKFFGYLKFLHPYLFLFTGYVLYWFWQKKMLLGIFSIIVYLYLIIPFTLKTLNPNALTLTINNIHKKIIATWGDKEYVLYNCPNTDIDRARGLNLLFVLKGNYNPESDNKLLYYYGNCQLPNFIKDNKIINPELSENKEDIFAKIDIVYDVSVATEGAILEKGGKKFTLEKEYHRAARWWYDEKP